MSTATNGRRREHNVRGDLLANGYRLIRAAGSKGPADLLAGKPGERLAVQVKPPGRTIMSPKQRADLIEWAYWFDAVPLVATKGPRGKGYLYRRLTGPGPKEFEPWSPDWAVTP